MKQLHIIATLPDLIKSCMQNFRVSYPKYGSGTIELTPYGDYILTTNEITDGSARRTSEYKTAYNKVTIDMFHAYQAEDRQYTCIHRQMPSVQILNKLQQELMNLSSQKYTRAITFSLSKPNKSDLELELEEEVESLNFGKIAKGELIDKKAYIKSRLSALIETRQSSWQEAYNLFDKIEKAKEEKTNAKYFDEYKALYKQKQEFIEGKESAVIAALTSMCENISIPYNLELNYDYNKQLHLLDVNLLLVDGINIPASKAIVLSSGKISIKNKLIKEMISDRTRSAIGLVYFMAANLFNISPNIYYLRISLFEENLQSPMLWVEFDRNQFANKRPDVFRVISDILEYPHVIDYKIKGNAVELVTIDKTLFDAYVVRIINEVNQTRPQSQNSYAEIDNG